MRAMNPILGWGLVVVLFAASWQGYGWQGVLAALSATVFWLLLQFNRAVRVMKNAGGAPVGHIGSAVMFNARLKPGMTMLQVVSLTKSLGRKVDEVGDTWAWRDAGDSEVTLHFVNGKLQRHVLDRPPQADAAAEAQAARPPGDASPAP
jgi:hypothetical protein